MVKCGYRGGGSVFTGRFAGSDARALDGYSVFRRWEEVKENGLAPYQPLGRFAPDGHTG